jgi:hypothetical protein
MNGDDIDFPFGANTYVSSERTAVVTESELLTWRDIEAERRTARADVATVASPLWSRAMGLIKRIRHPMLKLWASRWVDYCLSPGNARPVRHAGKAGKACRRVELALSRLGIVDPEGFEAIERAPRAKRRHVGAFRGVAGQLEEYRERMRGPWIG